MDIVYEDADLAVVNKPAGMVVHPGHGNESGTLVNALLARYPELADMMDDAELGERLGIAHRLDRGTSGLLVVARNKPTLLALMGQFQARTVDKVYLALLEKRPEVEYRLGGRADRAGSTSAQAHGGASRWQAGADRV